MNRSKNKKVYITIIVGVIVVVIVAILCGVNIKKLKSLKDVNLEYLDNVNIDQEFFDSMGKKELIRYKIENSVDFYKNVHGKYVKTDNNSNTIEYYNYFVQIDQERAYSETLNEKNEKILEILGEKNEKIQFNNSGKNYKNYETMSDEDYEKSKTNNVEKLRPNDRYTKNRTLCRTDVPYITIGRESVLNSELDSYLKEEDNWNIDSEEDFLGRKAYKISGEIGFTGKSGENNFILLVDEETGVILENKMITKTGEILSSLETTEIEFNSEPLIFDTVIDGFKEQLKDATLDTSVPAIKTN